MPAYVYAELAQKSINVEPCPCCRSEDIKFGSYDGDESMYCSAASVECNKCGHKVIINERDMGGRFSGKECQFAAIDKWNLQSKEYGGSRKAEDGGYDRLLIERLIHENMTIQWRKVNKNMTKKEMLYMLDARHEWKRFKKWK